MWLYMYVINEILMEKIFIDYLSVWLWPTGKLPEATGEQNATTDF